ncbi:MAG: acyltransferase [Paenibacillus sp.]|nr:acyltransferase [Paenibacillus sp.]
MHANRSEGKSTGRIAELDLVRAFAIIGVVTVHATSFATMELTGSSPIGYIPYIASNIAMKFGTPVFLFLSSLVLFMRYANRSLKKETLVSFYRKRLIHIIIPYTLCSTIYYIAVAATRPDAERPASYALDFMAKLFTGTAYAHLYFIFINIQFYLLFPLLFWVFRAYPRLFTWAVPLGIAIQGAFHLAGTVVEIPHESSWSLSYFAYYFLGAYVGARYSVIRERLLSLRRAFRQQYGILLIGAAWLATGLVHIVIWYKLRAQGTVSPEWLFYLLWSVYAFLSCLVLTYAALLLESRMARTRAVRGLKSLAAYSFGIYLLHPLLLAAYREFRPSLANPAPLHLWYVGGFLLALFGTWGVVSLAQRYMPFAWTLLGRLDGKPQAAARAAQEVSTIDGNRSF